LLPLGRHLNRAGSQNWSGALDLGCFEQSMLSPLPRSGSGARSRSADPGRGRPCAGIWGHPEMDRIYQILVDHDIARQPCTSSTPPSNALGVGLGSMRNRDTVADGTSPSRHSWRSMHVIDGGALQTLPRPCVSGLCSKAMVGWLPHWLGPDGGDVREMFALPVPGWPETGADPAVPRSDVHLRGRPADLGHRRTPQSCVGADRIPFRQRLARTWTGRGRTRWPSSATGSISPTTRKRAILVDGPAKYYGIDMPSLMAHLGAGLGCGRPGSRDITGPAVGGLPAPPKRRGGAVCVAMTGGCHGNRSCPPPTFRPAADPAPADRALQPPLPALRPCPEEDSPGGP